MARTAIQSQVDSAPRSEARPQDEVFRALRSEILLGRLRPSERLVEDELIARFGLGRYAIRSALDELSRIGLAIRRPNRGAVVADYNPAEIEKLYEMREILQRAAVHRMTFPVPRETIKALRAINQRYAECRKRGELEEVAEANAQFHRTLFGICQNEYLTSTIEQFRERTAAVHGYAVGVPHLAEQSHTEHNLMIKKLEKGDRAGLAELCVQHMRPALEGMRTARSRR
jgi:DNA-binding GntR family transcriptional regulator